MKPVSRRTLDWIYSVVGSWPGEALRGRLRRPAGGRPPISSAARNSKIHSCIKAFTLSPRLRLFLEDTLFRFLRKGGWVYSPPEPHLFEFFTVIPTLATYTASCWGEGSEGSITYSNFFFILLVFPLLHFSVAPRDRIAFLGICHLCINSGRTTTAQQGIPGQNLGDE